MTTLVPYEEAVEIVLEAGGEPLKLCYQCGLCTAVCPWNLVRSFGVRQLMLQSQLGLVDFESEDSWVCATCRACVDRCPRGVGIIDVMRALRRAMTELGFGHVPDSLKLALKNIAGTGNPLGEVSDKRADWAKENNVRDFAPGTELLYFPGCIPAYDPKVKRVAQATADVLTRLGADFGIIGTAESCCGESVRKAGDESLFQTLAQSNIKAFSERGVSRIIVSSPHCYYTFENEYPELGGTFEVIHFSQYLAELIDQGKLAFRRELNRRVVYHDPCYLGRHSGVYEAPRRVLASIPGLELVEMKESRTEAVCCGGGGGGIWRDTPKGERLSDLRFGQALDTGAEVLAVACPYCMLNFEDSRLTVAQGEALEIKDIAELVREALLD